VIVTDEPGLATNPPEQLQLKEEDKIQNEEGKIGLPPTDSTNPASLQFHLLGDVITLFGP
jgi:hypothetical protein